jgi:hypothetical protein
MTVTASLAGGKAVALLLSIPDPRATTWLAANQTLT